MKFIFAWLIMTILLGLLLFIGGGIIAGRLSSMLVGLFDILVGAIGLAMFLKGEKYG